jgi:hypothetical protein
MQAATTVKNVNQALANVLNKPTPANLTSAKQADVITPKPLISPELIATLWSQLTDIYGARFVNQYGEKDSGVWHETLADLTESDFCFGLQAMVRDVRFETWPPNCTQFRHLCLKKTILPSVHKAFLEARWNLGFATVRQWSHPAIKFTVKHVGLEKVNDAHTNRAFAAFSDYYERVCARIAAGGSLPDVDENELVISHKQQKPLFRLSQLVEEKATHKAAP